MLLDPVKIKSIHQSDSRILPTVAKQLFLLNAAYTTVYTGCVPKFTASTENL